MLPQKAVDALSANRDRMEKLVDALLKYDTISRREFVTLMETGALPDIQDADTRTTGDVMMQDMADERGRKFRKVRRSAPKRARKRPIRRRMRPKIARMPPMKPDLRTRTASSGRGCLRPRSWWRWRTSAA